MSQTVLLVDDNRDLAENLAEIVEAEGYRVLVAGGPKQAVELAVSEPFDVAVLDIRMPEMDGVSLYGKLLELRPHARYLLMTAFTADERIESVLASGVEAVFPKPVPVQELLERLPCVAGHAGPVLVVDDDMELADSLREALDLGGFEVRLAYSVAEAEAVLAERLIPAAVIDVHLPDGAGTALARRVAKEQPDAVVVLITGREPRPGPQWAAGLPTQAPHVLVKPFQTERLLHIIARRPARP